MPLKKLFNVRSSLGLVCKAHQSILTFDAGFSFFFQMMAKYSEVMEQAHKEIDSVLKQERLPVMSDRRSLPIVDCIMKEVLR